MQHIKDIPWQSHQTIYTTEPRRFLSLGLFLHSTLSPVLAVLFQSPTALIYDDILYRGGKCDDDNDSHTSRCGDGPPDNSSSIQSRNDYLMVVISKVTLSMYQSVQDTHRSYDHSHRSSESGPRTLDKPLSASPHKSQKPLPEQFLRLPAA